MLKVRILSSIIRTGTTYSTDAHVVGEFRIESANIKRSIKEFMHFSFEIKAEDLTSDVDLADPNIPIYAQIWQDDILYADGYILNVRYQKDKIIVECEDLLFGISWLGFESSNSSDGNFAWYLYNGVQALVILYDLMTLTDEFTIGFRDPLYSQILIGNFFYWETPHIAINFDMRELEVASDALFKLSDAVDGTFYAFGGYRAMRTVDSPFPRIDIGTFAHNTRFQYNENNILDIEIEKPHEPVLEGVSPYGGTYENPAGTENIIKLSTGTIPASAIDPGYDTFPGSNFVTPNPLPTSNYTRTQEIYVDAEVQTAISPGANQRARASTTLYREAIRVLKEAGTAGAEDTLQISSNEMPAGLMPGNLVNVNYEFKYPVFVPGLNKTIDRRMGNTQINNDFYVQEYDLTVYENDLDISLTLKTEPSFRDSDYTKLTKKKLRQIKKNKEFFVNRETPAAHVVGLYSVTVSGVAANTTLLGNPARATTVSKLGDADFGNTPSIPIGSSNIVTTWICTDPAYQDRVNLEYGTPPTAGVANFTIITQFDDNWTVDDNVTVKIMVLFNVV